MKRLFLFIAILLNILTFAQQAQCNCNQALEKLINKVENNYPGFSIKTKDQISYNEFKTNLINQSNNADNIACQKILKRYTDFFKDPHLWVGAKGAPFASESKSSSGNEKVDINIEDFQKKIKTSNDFIEGIWTMDNYKIGVKKVNSNEYIGFIIEAKSAAWKPGDIKFRLSANQQFEFAFMDRTKANGRYRLYENSLLFLEGVDVALTKQSPKSKLNPEQIEKVLQELRGFYFKKLSEKTSILKLPSFENHHLKEIDKLIEDNKYLLENSENLIIDVRGNPGGSTDAYQKLLPYISGKSIQHTGAEFLASETFLNSLENYKKNLGKDDSHEVIDKQIIKVKANLGKYFNYDEKAGLNRVQDVELAPKGPKNIVILVNKGTGSSAEYFLFVAKQSKKVKILGVPSYGALDYGNAILVDLDCEDYQLLLPTYRALRLPDYPIDNIGIQPDVYLDQSIEDWVEFAVEYLEN